MRALLAALLTVLTVVGCEGAGLSDRDAHVVGLVRLNFHDTSRSNWAGTGPRPIVTYVWYPAAMGAKMSTIGIPLDNPIFVGGKAARNASFSENRGVHPLIVMSHGTGGAGMQMMWLGRELAARGFIAAAVDHHGNTAAEDAYDPRGFRLPWSEHATCPSRLIICSMIRSLALVSTPRVLALLAIHWEGILLCPWPGAFQIWRSSLSFAAARTGTLHVVRNRNIRKPMKISEG